MLQNTIQGGQAIGRAGPIKFNGHKTATSDRKKIYRM